METVLNEYEVAEFIGLLVDEVLMKRCNGSVAAFNRLANSLADGVYFHIDQQARNRWTAWREEVAARKASKTKGEN